MCIHFYTHDILIIVLNCNKISLNIKLHVNSICVNEWLSVMQIYILYITVIKKFKKKFKEILKFEFVINLCSIYVICYLCVNQILIYNSNNGT
jgi:hypothetical protein